MNLFSCIRAFVLDFALWLGQYRSQPMDEQMAKTIEIEVIAHKSCTTTFRITVDAANHRVNAEYAIEEKLR